MVRLDEMAMRLGMSPDELLTFLVWEALDRMEEASLLSA